MGIGCVADSSRTYLRVLPPANSTEWTFRQKVFVIMSKVSDDRRTQTVHRGTGRIQGS